MDDMYLTAVFNKTGTFGSKTVRFPEELYTSKCDSIFGAYSLSIYDFFEGFGFTITLVIKSISNISDINSEVFVPTATTSKFLVNRHNNFDVSFECKHIFQEKERYLSKFSNTIQRYAYFSLPLFHDINAWLTDDQCLQIFCIVKKGRCG
jgi:hypothetical protein